MGDVEKNPNPEDLKVPELKQELKHAGASTEGNKDELVERLEEVQEKKETEYVPDVFLARFDPTDPPEEDPGPVVSD